MFSALANPHRFRALAGPTIWVSGALGLGLLVVGLAWGLAFAPASTDEGDTAVRIMYVHVPAAWLSMFTYAALAGASASYVIFRHTVADFVALAIAPIGAAFAFLTLATGSIWGRPAWGTWWEWDGRLASMLLLFLTFLAYIAVRAAVRDQAQARSFGAILALVGAVNLPIVKFSVDWWFSLHQPASVFRFDGPTLDGAFLWPLALSALGATAATVALVMAGARTEMDKARAHALARRAEDRAHDADAQALARAAGVRSSANAHVQTESGAA